VWAIVIKMTEAHASGEISRARLNAGPNKTPTHRVWIADNRQMQEEAQREARASNQGNAQTRAVGHSNVGVYDAFQRR
jgi:hypothetical protein